MDNDVYDVSLTNEQGEPVYLDRREYIDYLEQELACMAQKKNQLEKALHCIQLVLSMGSEDIQIVKRNRPLPIDR